MSSEITRHGKTIAERAIEHDVPEMNMIMGDIAECLGDAGYFLKFLRIASSVDRDTPMGADFYQMMQRIHKLSCMILEDEL